MRTAIITLYIDPESYKAETGKTLSTEQLEEYGRKANEDFAGVYGYSGWNAKFVDTEVKP